ncbi:hypothetical protein Ppa06_57840 [Planomonospora parontospora subsp. parontospora]|uniref:YspA cpYpsA-related SLOG domain-containing protein n=2 Tax=Planomonospora parontospora TaxID=58119 RepID=A0AA37BLI1_9ACTN|nr:SLOG family protein [Planomonospora parontospora]GGK90502.1 hypothetical protein GCM10010126_57470 [Planomonospora parontospora]GII11986.1 hypothetical protein Ppa06_57840 [Planomonospora parontospora subsp. parontospora]
MGERFTLLLAGPRDGVRPGPVWDDLDRVHAAHPSMLLVEGGCSGVDTFGREWVTDRRARGWDIEGETYRAPWRIPELSKAAGPARYGFMIGMIIGRGGPCGALVYLRPGSTGSAGTAAFAKHVGMSVWRRPAPTLEEQGGVRGGQ